MADTANTLLVVDDEDYNIKIIRRHLEKDNFRITSAGDGIEAWDLLKKSSEAFDAIILDRIMPHMDGMELLRKIKADRSLKEIPVIFQTAMSNEEDVLEGLQAGAYYYLTKPYKRNIMRAVVQGAVSDHTHYKDLRAVANETAGAISLITSGRFEFRTFEEGYKLSTLLANITPSPRQVVSGLWELFANAVEHGNLGITYKEKSRLMENSQWKAEVNRRLALPENRTKVVTVQLEFSDNEIHFHITDQGQGFDWRKYEELSPDRAFDSHGRGIAIARLLSFDRLEYRDPGNEVLAVNCETSSQRNALC